MENVKVYAGEVAAVFPVGADLSLQVLKRHLVGIDRRDVGDLGTKELRR